MSRSDLAVGVGLRPGTTAEVIVAAVREALGDRAVGRLATLDRRAGEPGFLEAALRLHAVAMGFSALELAAVAVPNPSSRVSEAVGATSVAEAAAVLAGGGGDLTLPKTVVSGIVVAAVEFDLLGPLDLGS
ncbi:cobalamin biosynthesis protein [Nocardia sp. NPDC004151]|uniref:cobalamin biosynthesis protein n=1 Tax=Nocardia sp. NPDC004151 TaxID=3364304 RepID=UPI0036870AA9